MLLALLASATLLGPASLDSTTRASPPSEFTCGERKLLARFGPGPAGPVAEVDVGEGPRVLPLAPWTGGEPQVRWTDGRRTLTWSPGVQLMWMDGATHLMCGRAAAHRH